MYKKILSLVLALVLIISIPVSVYALTVNEQEDIYRVGTEWNNEYNQTYINWLLNSDNFLYHLDVTRDGYISSIQYPALNLSYSERKENFEQILTSLIGLSYDGVREESQKEVFADYSVTFLKKLEKELKKSETFTSKAYENIQKGINSAASYYLRESGITPDKTIFSYDEIYNQIVKNIDDANVKASLVKEYNAFVDSSEWLSELSALSFVYDSIDDAVKVTQEGFAIVAEFETYKVADEKFCTLLRYIMNNTSDDALYSACYDVYQKFAYDYEEYLVSAVLDIAEDATVEWAIESVKEIIENKCGIYAIFAKIGIEAGKTVSDIWFNTSEIKKHCQTMFCVNEISEILVPIVSENIYEMNYWGNSDEGAYYASNAIYNMAVLIRLRKLGEAGYYNLKNSAYDADIVNACQTLGWCNPSSEDVIEDWYNEFSNVIINVRNSLFRIIPPDYYYDFGVTPVKDLKYTIENSEVTVTGFCGDYTLEELVIPAYIEGYPVTKIGNYAFEHHYSLISAVIPDGVIEICEGAFSRCTSLSELYIPDSVTRIGSWILENTVIENNENYWDDNALYVGNHLISVKAWDGSHDRMYDTIVVKDGTKTLADHAMLGCYVEKIILPDGLISIGDGAFSETFGLKTVDIPDSVEYIGKGAFEQSGNLEELVLPEGITEIGSSTFFDCCSLTEMVIPSGVKSIGSHAFIRCGGLKKVVIPDGVKSIGDSAFYDCGSLTSVTIPASVTTIGDKAFGYYTDWDSEDYAPTKFKDFTIKGTKDSAAHKYATKNGFKFVDVNHKKHTSSSWITDKKATVYSAGKKHKECTVCGKILKTAKIAQLKCSKPELKAISNTSSGVEIFWNGTKGADKYRVYRKTSKSDWEYIGSTSNTYYTDKTAKSGTKYYYAIKARNEAGNSGLSKSLSKYYISAPKLKTAKSTKKGIKLEWSKVKGAEGYIVFREVSKNSYSSIATIEGSSKLSYTDKTAKKGKKYKYMVMAYYSKTYSSWSNTKEVKDKY